MDARDRHNGQRDKRTNERTDGRTEGTSVRRLLDGVWHILLRAFFHWASAE